MRDEELDVYQFVCFLLEIEKGMTENIKHVGVTMQATLRDSEKYMRL